VYNSKKRLEVSILDLNDNILLEDEWFPLGRKVKFG
jgi:hypothetical protein